ncbi:hypothetical protein PGT21_010167 [Puccinia graminis f. sp. tritici]|uniref:Uncharacterized protein n=1 Tax=Puccinia graminis f. sp. tritici TaxID=56615 RepID=A0A5B0SEJ0_PUCGR|nr:hypothetical protein PGT21_010167 [Puccinia graminis f. sp. tritici]KAA1135945.1 hypothetical protein PGTUg99_006713 [Puccinia graminis f. sp. tritici]
MNSYIAGYQWRECQSAYAPDDQEPTLPVGVLAFPQLVRYLTQTRARNMGSSPIAPAVYS